MALNLNNSLSVPTSTVISVSNFASEEANCLICHSNELIDSKGKPHKIIVHEGKPDHGTHAKCLRAYIKQILNQNGGVLPFGLIKCFHCQIALDVTGINNEVFEQKIPKELFARTLKFITKTPGNALQTISNLTTQQKTAIFLTITLLTSPVVAFGIFKIGAMIWNQALHLISPNLQYTDPPPLLAFSGIFILAFLNASAFCTGIMKLGKFLGASVNPPNFSPFDFIAPLSFLLGILALGTTQVSNQQ